jgi:hypothetical protein
MFELRSVLLVALAAGIVNVGCGEANPGTCQTRPIDFQTLLGPACMHETEEEVLR